jgi:very-short-patch-repair endonuclease
MLESTATKISGLSSEAAKVKRAAYFSSDLHKQKASAQARRLAEHRKQNGISFLPKKCDTKPELVVESVLKTLKLEYRKQEPVGPYLFDFYLPDARTLIEVDGEYYHSRPEAIANDLAKEGYIRNQHPGVTIIRITELDTMKKGYVEKFLRRQLCLSSPIQHTIELESCQVKECDLVIASDFLARYHYLPRFRKSTKAVHGVYHRGDLIAVIIYSNPSYQTVAKKYGYKPSMVIELARFVIADGYHVYNLASWSLSRSIKLLKNKYGLIVSYADPHFGFSGHIYKASGWEEVGQTQASYYYLDQTGAILHKKTVWDHAKKMGMPETTYATANFLRKVECEPKTIYVRRLTKLSPKIISQDQTVPVTCRCGAESQISNSAYKRAKKKHGCWVCLSCSIANGWKDGKYNTRSRRSGTNLDQLVTVICECGTSATIKQKSLNYAIRKHSAYVCMSCAVKKSRGS